MKGKSLVVLTAIVSMIMLSFFPAIKTAKARSFSSIWFDPFSGPTVYDSFDGPLVDRWATYRGDPTIVQAGGRPSVLRLAHPETGDAQGPFASPVGTSLFLANPTTANFADGMIEFDLYFENSGWEGVSAMITFRMQSDDTYYALRLTSTRDWYCSFIIYAKNTLQIGNWREIGSRSETAAFPTGAWSHVVLTIGASRMSCYRDGILVCSVEDDTWSKGSWGGIGLQNNYYGGVFYIDNFNIPGRMKWTTYRGSPRIDTNFGRLGSSMRFDHPGEKPRDEASFGDEDSCSAFILDPDLRQFESGVIEFDICFDNEGGQKAFITFRMLNEHSYYAARLTSTYDWPSFFVRRTGADDWYVMGSSVQGWWPFSTQVWIHVTIIIDGNHFELWREWRRLFSADDSSIVRGKWGGIGFFSAYYGGTFHIDNLKICIQG